MKPAYPKLLGALLVTLLGVLVMIPTAVPRAQESTNATLAIAQSFLDAAGAGDKDKLRALMSDDFVWHNEGDTNIPWIGNWEGRDTVLNIFLPAFGSGLKITSWTTDFSFVKADQAMFVGTMSGITTKSGVNTGTFSWAVRVRIEGGKVKSWNWFEDSYAVSQAYNSLD